MSYSDQLKTCTVYTIHSYDVQIKMLQHIELLSIQRRTNNKILSMYVQV